MTLILDAHPHDRYSRLHMAKTLDLIDPFMNSRETRWFDTIRVCAEVMGQEVYRRIKGRIRLHANLKRQLPEDRDIAYYQSQWTARLTPLVDSEGHSFEVFLWTNLPESKTQHDRFILTDQCGISTPGGLDCRTESEPNDTDWSLLDKKTYDRRRLCYQDGTSPFDLASSFSCIGNLGSTTKVDN